MSAWMPQKISLKIVSNKRGSQRVFQSLCLTKAAGSVALETPWYLATCQCLFAKLQQFEMSLGANQAEPSKGLEHQAWILIAFNSGLTAA